MMSTFRLNRVDAIASRNEPIDVYLVASSFEPRSVRATSLIQPGAIRRAVIFQYQDTLDTALGQDNARQIREKLAGIGTSAYVLSCRFSEPYSVTKAFHVLLKQEDLIGRVRSVFVDITCFTKLHMLLLLKYLERRLRAVHVTVIYTEPLAYGTAFGKALTYGVDRTVYLPYRPEKHRSRGVGLIAFLGHERQRLECIIQELEPDISVIILGEPGYTRGMFEDSKRINEGVLNRSNYDRHYRLVTAPSGDTGQVAQCLEEQVDQLKKDGYDSVYFAPLGTKLQALGIDEMRRSDAAMRMLLAYAIPSRYEKHLYSQGSGPTYKGVLYDNSGRTGSRRSTVK